MSKENESAQLIKYCVHCGAKVDKKETYCPKCGKLVINLKSMKEISEEGKISRGPESLGYNKISRKCAGCGSIITSTVLDQCPICSSLLEPLPEIKRPVQSSTGFIFTNKKLEAEQKFTLNKGSWKFREGLHIFFNSIMFYVIAYFLIIIIYLSTVSQNNQDITIFLILLSQLPSLLFGIIPLWYIYTRKHKYEKLGFSSDKRKNRLALIIGILGGLGIIAISYLSGYTYQFLYDIGLDFYDIQTYIDQEYRIIRGAGLWLIILLVELIFASISIEIAFRGVLHNTLKEKFNDNKISGKILISTIVALVYSAFFLALSFPIGIYFLIPNFLIFLLLGMLYEINDNIYNTIIALIIYNVLMITFIIYF